MMNETMDSDTKEPEGKVADAPKGNWVDLYAPAAARPFLRLSRADRPIGTWLLLIPCWWGVLLAALIQGHFGLPEVRIMLVAAFGAFLMRGAGCTWNDITDRKIDAAVERTRSRPLPSGQVSVKAAVIWMGMQALIALLLLLTLNKIAILLGVISLIPVLVYPFAKRFTWWPQVFLGIAFNWGILLCSAAVLGHLSPPFIVLYAAGIVWTLFYDTIYALQDVEDDALIGVRSTARLFGGNVRMWLQVFLIASVTLMGASFIMAALPAENPLVMVIAIAAPWAFGWHMAWQMRHLDAEDPASCLKAFRSNRDAGLVPALFLALALVV
jgi:4-hydroxybenzoate polyprenyltransferase